MKKQFWVLVILFQSLCCYAIDRFSYYEELARVLPHSYEERPSHLLNSADLVSLWRQLFPPIANFKSFFPTFLYKKFWLPSVDMRSLIYRLSAFTDTRKYMPRLGRFGYAHRFVRSGDTVIHIGYLGGSFFSLVHILRDLVARGQLDASLRLTDPNALVVFSGDFSSPSPFWLYTIELLLSLWEQNPDQLIVLRGRAERFGRWESVETQRTYLKRLANDQTVSALPYAKELNQFFDSLPDAVRLISKETNEEILISHQRLPPVDVASPQICAWIASPENKVFPGAGNGFIFNRFQVGVAQWILFSGPDFLSSHEMSSYLVYSITKELEKLSAVHRYGNRLSPSLLFKEKRYALAFGFELQREDDQKRLALAQREFVCASADLSGGTALVGDSLSLGVQAVLVDANQRGLCAPILFRHVVFDDQYTPVFAKQNIDRFLQDYHATYVLAPQGSPTLSSYIDLVKDKKIAVFFTESGATQFRSPDIPFIVNLRSSFLAEVTSLLDYCIKKLSPSKLAVIYQDDAFGNPLLKATEKFVEGMPEKTLELSLLPYVRGQASFAYQNQLVKETNATLLAYYIASGGAALGLFSDDMTVFFKGRNLFFVLVDESILRVLRNRGIPSIFSSSVPDPYQSRLDMVEAYRDIFGKFKPLSVHSLLGFISGEVFIHGVNRLLKENKTLNGANLVNIFEQFSQESILDMKFSFDPLTRSFNLPIWIQQADKTWIQTGSGASI